VDSGFQQAPAAGQRVALGTSVVVSVALAPLVKVPDVARRPRDVAERLLNFARLRSAFSDDDASELDPGVVAAQEPAPGSEVDASTVVRLRVATGVLVPAVVGSNPDDARTRARSSGLAASVTDVRTDAATSGTVFEQKPGAGERVPRGTTLQLSVARTPLVVVPNLIQQTRAEATNAAQAVRLAVAFEEDRDSTLPPDRVIRQDPAAGASAEIGTTMRVAVATGVAVPDVSRLPVATARSQLETAGLRADEVREVSTSSPESTVLRQSPDATAIVARGSAVRLVVAALQTVTVPNVVGRTRSEVERLLTSIRLGVAFQVAAAPDGTGPAGTIVRQDPVAGANVAADTVLRVFVVAQVVQPPLTLVDWLRALNLISTLPALLGIGLLSLVAYRFVKANRGSLKKKPDGGDAPPTPDVVLDPHPGDLTTRLEVSGEGLIDFEVRLRVGTDGGQQSLTVDGPLLENEKRVYE
jgi:beta-lactam-binding protein with PASTA domain